MFVRKYWLPLSVFLVAICAVGLYYLQTQPPKEPIKIYKVVEPLAKPTAEVSEGDTLQGGPVNADGTWHDETHEAPQPSDETFESESDAEFKARVEKEAAELAAAETARERNEIYMRQLEASPYFHLYENVYNFYKAHPDYDHANHETNSPELKQKYADAVYADVAKARAHAKEKEAEYERNRYKDVDKSPFIPHQDQGGQH